MTNSILEQAKMIIFLAILGSVVTVIGLYTQSLAITAFGVLIATSLPILGLILSLIDGT